MCKRKINVSVPKVYNETTVNAQWVYYELRKLNVDCTHLWDSYYVAYTVDAWAEILIDVIKNMPSYVGQEFDCDNFALLTAARVMERYSSNAIGIAIGDSPMGAHAWNIFITWEDSEARIRFYEPQTGEVMELENDQGYKIKQVIWG